MYGLKRIEAQLFLLHKQLRAVSGVSPEIKGALTAIYIGLENTIEGLSGADDAITKAVITYEIRIKKLKEQIVQLTPPTRLPDQPTDERLSVDIRDCSFSTRTINCLTQQAGIKTVGDLVGRRMKDLMKLRNFGIGSRREIYTYLDSVGLEMAH